MSTGKGDALFCNLTCAFVLHLFGYYTYLYVKSTLEH